MPLQARIKTMASVLLGGSNVSQIRELDAADLVNQLVVEMLEDE